MIKYNVKKCPWYDIDLLECKSEKTSHVCCYKITSKDCPMKQIIDYCLKYKNEETQTILDMFEVAEIEE